MGRLDGRLRKVEERAESLHEELTLPSGRVVQIMQGDCFAAVLSVIEHMGVEDSDSSSEALARKDLEPLHWLAQTIIQDAGGEIPGDPTADDFVMIVCALASSSRRGGNEV